MLWLPTQDLFVSTVGFQLWIQLLPPGCVRGSPLHDAWTPDNGIGSDRLSMLAGFMLMQSCAQDGAHASLNSLYIKLNICIVFMQALTSVC